MKFSLLIAHYNNHIYFKDCLKSIINQTFSDFEIVILDDFSNQDSYNSICESIKNDSRFSIYRNDENKGVGYTKNKLIELAKGEICGFLDPDDALVPNAVEKSLDMHSKFKDCSSTYSKMMMCNENLNPMYLFKRTSKIINQDPLFVNIDTSVAHFFSFKKSKIIDFSPYIDYTLRAAVDQDLYLKLYEKGNFIYINEPLYNYRLHSEGVSQSSNKNNAKSEFKKVIRNTLERRNVIQLNGKDVNMLSDDELYSSLVTRENSISMKFKKLLCRF